MITRAVVETPSGDAIFHNATADSFERGVLTISASDGLELRPFPPGDWRAATVFDSRGNVLYSIRAGQPAESRNAS